MTADSIAEKKCLLITSDAVVCNFVESVMVQIGIASTTKADAVQSALLSLVDCNCDIVICALLDTAENLAILKAVRYHDSTVIATIPVICISDKWVPDQIMILRDAGSNLLVTLPITMRKVVKQFSYVFSGAKEFVSCDSYRGPCRRRVDQSGYAGPFRRSTDKAASKRPQRISAAEHREEEICFPPPPRPSDDAMPGDETSGDPIEQQTWRGVQAVTQTARYIATLLEKMPKEGNRSYNSSAMRFIAGHLDRWINLIVLLASRIEMFGCTPHQLESLEWMQTFLHDQLIDYVVGMTAGVIAEGEKVVLAPGEVPIRIGNRIVRKLACIDGLIQSLGKVGALPENIISEISTARTIVATIEKRMPGTLVLSDLTNKTSHRSGGHI